MKVCMVYPNIMKFPRFLKKVTNLNPKPVLLPPLGMLYVISNSDYRIEFIHNGLCKYSDKELYNRLKKYDVVGFGGTIFECLQAKNVSSLLIDDGIITMYGGPNATVNWQKYTGNFDIIIKGEGEITTNEVLNNIAKEKSLKEIKGIVFNENGKIINNPDRPFIQDLDKLNYPAREILDLTKYLRDEEKLLPQIYPVDTIISSRGCPFDCTFCSSKYFWKRKYRSRKPKEVVEEIRYMIDKFGTKGIYFREDLFTLLKKRVLEFCKLVKPFDIDWICESRVDTVDEEMLKAMRKSGCKAIWFGMESCSNKTLNLIKKGITVEQSQRAINLCKKVGIYSDGMFMIGLPNETKEDMLHTFKASREWRLDKVGYNRVFAIPKSKLYNTVKKEGLDRYEYENIIIPDTRYVHANEVTNIYYNNMYNWIIRMWLRLPENLRKFIIEHHDVYTKLQKWAHYDLLEK